MSPVPSNSLDFRSTSSDAILLMSIAKLMADKSPPDYKALLQKAEEERRQEAELRRQAEEREKQAEEREKQAQEREKQEAELRKRAESSLQLTTFREFIRACHVLLSQPLRAGTPRKSTKGSIPAPTGKYCPSQLRHWSDCPVQQQAIFDEVCTYLQPTERIEDRLFASLAELQGLSRSTSHRLLQSEKDLESYERLAVEDRVHEIIAELCNIPAAQSSFQLGQGVVFDNHANTLEEPEDDDVDAETADLSSVHHPRPDQFCIHRVDGTTNSLLMTVEYKPPHKLSVKNLQTGLRPMNFWTEVVRRDKIPTDKDEKLVYNAQQLTGSVLAQEYHVMIQEGLEYSYITIGLALVLLHIPYNDPSTLDYYFCEPNRDVNLEDSSAFLEPKTAIARVLCLCLMSSRSGLRDQAWRRKAKSELHIWTTSFDHTRSQIPDEELQQSPPDSEHISSEYTSSEYQPSSPLQSTTEQARQVPTRSRASCAPTATESLGESMNSSDSDSGTAAAGRKRGFSQLTSSPPSQRSSARPTNIANCPSSRDYQHTARFCTQRCLLGLQKMGPLDGRCPNVDLHRQDLQNDRHRIDAEQLVQQLQAQLNQDLDDNCTPFGFCGSYGAPFKITCATYGYTVVGKGTTTRRWKEVFQEVEIYRLLRKAQGSAATVFLGAIDLDECYFLHGAGEIRHMLLMAWGGENIKKAQTKTLRHEIAQSKREIRQLGIVHKDLHRKNMLWNAELGRVLIIDFHWCDVDWRPPAKRSGTLKRRFSQSADNAKRTRLLYT